MSLISFFLTQECTIRPFDRMGDSEPIFCAEESRPCRLEEGKHLRTVYKNPNGEIQEVEAKAKLFCEGGEIPSGSIVICGGREYIVVDCHAARGFALNHQEAYLM